MSKILNELRFRTPKELLEYRQIHVDAVTNYENEVQQTPEIIAAITRHKEYLRLIDILLHDAFLGTVKDKVLTGVNIDPLLFPGVDVKAFIVATNVLSLGAGGGAQKQLEFKEAIDVAAPSYEMRPMAAAVLNSEQTGLPVEQIIKALLKEKGQTISSIVEAGKVFCLKTGILNPDTEPIDKILTEMLKNEQTAFVGEIKVLNFCGCWMLSLLRQHKTPVTGMLNLKLKFFDSDPMEVGRLYQWVCEYAFNRNQKEGKFQGLSWKEYVAAMDSPFRIAMNKEDVTPKREKIERETYQGEIIARDLTVMREIYSNEDVAKYYLSYATSIKDAEKKKLFITEDNKPRPDVFARTIEECISYGSCMKRDAIAERRIKQMTGKAPMKEYKEGEESGYQRS